MCLSSRPINSFMVKKHLMAFSGWYMYVFNTCRFLLWVIKGLNLHIKPCIYLGSNLRWSSRRREAWGFFVLFPSTSR